MGSVDGAGAANEPVKKFVDPDSSESKLLALNWPAVGDAVGSVDGSTFPNVPEM